MFFFSKSFKFIIERFRKKDSESRLQNLKILVIGLAKSGTSILMYRIAGGLNNPIEFFEPRSMLGQNDVEFHQRTYEAPRDVITKIIFHPEQNARLEDIFPSYDKVIWIIRDPRDQLISSYFYQWYNRHQPNKKAFWKALEKTKQKELHPSTIPFHTLSHSLGNPKKFPRIYEPTIRIVEDWKNVVFKLRYEDFIIGNVEKLESYLGTTLDMGASVKSHASRVSRSNSTDNWRRWFTPEDVTFYKPLLSPYLKSLGYDSEDWDLTPCERLLAKEGSEYMLALFSN